MIYGLRKETPIIFDLFWLALTCLAPMRVAGPGNGTCHGIHAFSAFSVLYANRCPSPVSARVE